MKILKKTKALKNFANNCLHSFKDAIYFVLVPLTIFAQEFNMNAMPPPEMSMEYSQGELKAGSILTVKITIPENWHVNANEAADEFLKPSEIEAFAQGIHFGSPVWPPFLTEYSEALDLNNQVFRGEIQVVLPVDSVASQGYDSLSTNVTFRYQACDNSICLPPAEKTVKLDDFFGQGGSEKKASHEEPGEKFDIGFEGAAAALIENADGPSGNKESEGESRGGMQDAGTLALLLFAFLGGLILNLMPCVLPVLSLKLFSLMKQAGESRKRLLALGLSTTAGILVSFWALAAIVTAVKMGGGNAGWGMQFQSAGFIAFMVVILSAFAMSFFGVFEVWLPWSATTRMDSAGNRQGLTGAFFTGALLVLLSTPCSAPFLGTAMGFAFTASAPVLFLFFTAAGVGLALPYLLASAFPSVLKVFPKPGTWMVKLQKAMGALLLVTVGWLFWIVNNQAGAVGMGLFSAVAAVAILASFVAGKFAPPGVAFAREMGVFALSAAVLFSLWFGVLAPRYENVVQERFNARMAEQMTEDGWYRYSPALVEEFKKAGRTLFIDVSADWCITCKANEAAVLNREDFTRAMDSLKVARVKADWTRETPEVNALLRSMKKSGVPAYAIYPQGDADRQIVLPELLTTGSIVEKIKGR